MKQYIDKQDVIEAINKASLEEWYETRQTSAVAFRILEKLEELPVINESGKPTNIEVIAQKMLGIGPDDGPLFTLACEYWETRGGGCKDCPLMSKCEDINVEAWLKQEVEK